MAIIKNQQDNPLYKWMVAVSVMSGAFMVVMDTTVVNVALPKIMAAFGANIDKIQWVVTAYMLSMAIMMPSVGWLSSRIGNKALFVSSLTIFTLASALCGTAWNEDALIIFRILQGVGAGSLMPIAMAIIFEAFPPEQRGLAMGVYGLGATFGPAVGPTLGGYLTEKFSWHLIFYLNVPVGLLGVFLAMAILPQGRTRKGLRFDFWGFLTMAIGLGCLLMALSQGQREGWTSSFILFFFFASMLAFAAFFFVEFHTPQPFIDLKVYRSFTYSMATAVFVIQGLGLFGATFLIPLFFENMLQYTALQTGFLMLPMALAVSVVLPLTGRLADRMDARILIAMGIFFSIVSLYWLSLLDLRTSTSSAVGMLIMRGFGIGFIFPALMNTALKNLPLDKVATGSGLMNVSRQVGGAFGVAILGAMLDRRQVFHLSLFSQAQNLNSLSTSMFIQRLQESFMGLGSGADAAYQKALAFLHLFVKKEAMVAAYDDCFLIAAGFFLFAFIPTLLLRTRKH